MTANKASKATRVQKLATPPPSSMTDEERRKAIEVAAYYRWLGRGGNQSGEVDDWLEAEEEVMRNVFDRGPEE